MLTQKVGAAKRKENLRNDLQKQRKIKENQPKTRPPPKTTNQKNQQTLPHQAMPYCRRRPRKGKRGRLEEPEEMTSPGKWLRGLRTQGLLVFCFSSLLMDLSMVFYGGFKDVLRFSAVFYGFSMFMSDHPPF